VVVDCHHHIERRSFAAAAVLRHDIHRIGRDAGTLEKLPKLRNILRRQFLGARLMQDVSVLADRKQNSAVWLLTSRTDSFDEMQCVRPG